MDKLKIRKGDMVEVIAGQELEALEGVPRT